MCARASGACRRHAPSPRRVARALRVGSGHPRRERLAELSGEVCTVISDCRYHSNVVKLGAKFDEELKKLLDELRQQASDADIDIPE